MSELYKLPDPEQRRAVWNEIQSQFGTDEKGRLLPIASTNELYKLREILAWVEST